MAVCLRPSYFIHLRLHPELREVQYFCVGDCLRNFRRVSSALRHFVLLPHGQLDFLHLSVDRFRLDRFWRFFPDWPRGRIHLLHLFIAFRLEVRFVILENSND